MAQAVVERSDKTIFTFPRYESLIAPAAFLIIALFVFGSFYQITPPRAVPADAPAAEFSSARALKHIERIATRPHPVGSIAHGEVRDFIIAEVTTMGIEPEVQKTTGVRESPGLPLMAGTIENILVRLKGTDTGKAVLIVGHYDSVPTSPGASDDGAAVAAMLETIRALHAGPPLKNDLLFLFTDAEEVGLLGAEAFISENPAAREVGVALNFEARGTGGAAVMFETGAENGRLISEFARAAPHPVANSLLYEIYRLLPNDTDFTIFKEAAVPGFNFAYIEGLNHYHTQLDSIEMIDERSLQHEGSYALALSRHFGNLNLEQTSEPDAIYFNIPGSVLVHYSSEWAAPSFIFALVVFAAVVAYGFGKKRLTLRGIVSGFFAFALSLLASVLAVTFAFYIISLFERGDSLTLQGEIYNGHYYFAAFAALTVAMTSALYIRFRRWASVAELSAGALIWWLILAAATGLYLPGGSYLFVWPLLFSLLGLIPILVVDQCELVTPMRFVALCACAIPGILLFVPIIYIVFLAMSLEVAALLAALMTLFLGLLIPHISLMARPAKWLLPAGALLTCAALIIAGSLSDKAAGQRQSNSIFYAMSGDSGQAVWASYDQEPDEWTAQFMNGNIETGSLNDYMNSSYGGFMKAPAPAVNLSSPVIELLDESKTESGRILRFRVASSRHAPVISLYTDPDTEVLASVINGRRIAGENGKPFKFQYHALPAEGIEVSLELKSSGTVRIKATDQSYGLPEMENMHVKPRPDYMMASSLPYSDSTLVSKSFAF